MISLILAKRGFAAATAARSLYTDLLARVKPTVPSLSVSEVNAIIRGSNAESLRIFDVREPYEWNEDRIPRSEYTGRGTLEKSIEQLASTSDEILLYCSNGNRSLLAANDLKQMGYKNVKYLAGGLSAWKSAHIGLIANLQVGKSEL